MSENLPQPVKMRMEKTAQNLRKNNMEAYIVPSKEDVVPLIESLCQEGEKVASGGSVTLAQCGVTDFLKSGRYDYLDRYKEGADMYTVMREAFFADSYFTSSNAVTEDGELFNVDGNGNRVAAMIFGPKKVIVVAGCNKIVESEKEAVARIENTAAPLNAARLGLSTPCAETGKCVHCLSPWRICCAYVKMGFQRAAGRVKVILVGEELGY